MICGSSPRVLGHGLKIALRFAAMRRQFAKPGEKEETPLIEYPLHQFRLFPYVAKSVAFLIASNTIFKLWYSAQSEKFDPKSHKMSELHAIISAMKGVASTAAVKGL